MNPHKITEKFEKAVAKYTGAPYAIATTSCTMAIFLALQYLKWADKLPRVIDCPARTYVSVPMQIVHVGALIQWTDEEWEGQYELAPTKVIDSARLFTSGMYRPGTFMCTSHHWGKTLGVQQGGMILHDNKIAHGWFKRARFDGRQPGVHPVDDHFIIGWHAYMSPEVAAEGLVRLGMLPRDNKPLPNDNYPDLSRAKCFAPYCTDPPNQRRAATDNSRVLRFPRP